MKISKRQWTVDSDQWSGNKEKLTTHHSSLIAGFTLIELLVVIAIIGMLAAILTPTISMAREKGRRAVCVGNLKVIGEAFNMYNIDRGEMPPTEDDLASGPPDNDATNKIGDTGATMVPIGMGYFYDDPNVPLNTKNDYIEDFAVFVCPSSSDGDLRNSQAVKQKWENNTQDVCSAYIYRAESGYLAGKETLMLSDAKPAIVMDYNLKDGNYNHKGEYVNILFRNGNVKGVKNKDSAGSNKDGQLTFGGDDMDGGTVDKDKLFRHLDGSGVLIGGADSYQ